MNLPEISVKLQNPEELTREEILECQNIEYDAYRSTLHGEAGAPLSHEALSYMTWLDDPERYYDAFRNLNVERGRSLRQDQDFMHMQVARSYVDGVIGGFGWSADNVSGGSERIRNLKRHLPIKNYFYIGKILTLPEFQDEGVATENAKALLGAATSQQQTVTHYDWPSLQPAFVNQKIEELGFTTKPSKNVRLLGPNTPEIAQVRRSGVTVDRLLGRLLAKG